MAHHRFRGPHQPPEGPPDGDGHSRGNWTADINSAGQTETAIASRSTVSSRTDLWPPVDQGDLGAVQLRRVDGALLGEPSAPRGALARGG